MISFLYRLASDFEHANGYRPNLIYLHPTHFSALQQDLAAIQGLGELARFLGMEVIVDSEIVHPHVGWSSIDWTTAVAV